MRFGSASCFALALDLMSFHQSQLHCLGIHTAALEAVRAVSGLGPMLAARSSLAKAGSGDGCILYFSRTFGVSAVCRHEPSYCDPGVQRERLIRTYRDVVWLSCLSSIWNLAALKLEISVVWFS